MIGAAPFGHGLQEWLKRSPGFNLKGEYAVDGCWRRSRSLLFMWQPYAGLSTCTSRWT